MSPVRVLIVDDHPLYRRGIRAALSNREGIEVVGEVGTAEDAIARCRADAPPDIVLLDINLPDRTGIEAAREIKRIAPGVGIIALTAYDDEAYVVALAEAGAQGYLLKSATDDEIALGVRTVSRGEAMFSPAATSTLLRRARGDYDADRFGLSDRECQVLSSVARGMTNREVGKSLDISDRTVQAHLSHIFDKLDVSSRTEAVTKALRHGLIELEDHPATDSPE